MWINLEDRFLDGLKKLAKGEAVVVRESDPPFLVELAKKIENWEAEQRQPLAQAYVKQAQQKSDEGTLEVDDSAHVSFGNSNGAYVQAWLWVYQEDLKPIPKDKL